MSIKEVERLDEDPDYVVTDAYGKLFAISNLRDVIRVQDVGRKVHRCLVVQQNGRIGFASESAPDRFLPPSMTRSLHSGQDVFVRRDDDTFRACILSKDKRAAHAAKIDTGKQNAPEPVEFHTTSVPPALWEYAGYTAVIRYRGRKYATIAPFWPSTLGITFGLQFEEGCFDVIDVKKREIQGFYPPTPKIRCRFVDGA